MTTELEQRLSNGLHREAADLVPQTRLRPLPSPNRRWLGRGVGPGDGRWRAPLLVAVAVLLVALTTSMVIQSHRERTASGVAGTQVSPVRSSPAAPFACVDEATLHAAQAGQFLIGITRTMFCVSTGSNQVSGSRLTVSGALRSLGYTESVASGAVDSTIDRVVWVPRGTDERAGITIDLYALGPVNGFAFPLPGSGTVLLYSGGTVIDREPITLPDDAPPAASSPAKLANTPNPRAQPSYPPGQTGPSQRAHPFPTNARGQTYGSSLDADGETGEPDLIEAIATNGRTGYVLRTDLELAPPTDTSEAIGRNTAGPRSIPVYLSDGITKIGVFTVQAP